MGNRPLVSVFYLCYNQKEFVEESMRSILSQETDFEIELLVHDDASTDGTAEIVRRLAAADQRIKPILREENLYSVKGLDYFRDFLLPLAQGEYIAVCEGDDYWTNPHKLQMEVDYLRAHPSCTMACGRADVIDGVSGQSIGSFGYGEIDKDLTVVDLLNKWEIPTASVLFKKVDAAAYYADWTFDKPVGDFPRAIYLASLGYVHYFGDRLSVYRYSVPGSWSTSVKRSREKKVSNSIDWLKMLSEIDVKLGHRFHNEIVAHARQYSVMLRAYGSDCKLPLFNESLRNINLKSRIKLFAYKACDLLGVQIVKTRWSGLIKWRIERLR